MNQRPLALALLAAGAIASIATSPPRWSAQDALDTQSVELFGDVQHTTVLSVETESEVRHGASPVLEVEIFNVQHLGDNREPVELHAWVAAPEALANLNPHGSDVSVPAEGADWVTGTVECEDERDCAGERVVVFTTSRPLAEDESLAFDWTPMASIGGSYDTDEDVPSAEIRAALGQRSLSSSVGGEVTIEADGSETILLHIDAASSDVPVDLEIALTGEQLDLVTIELSQSGELVASGPGTEPLVIDGCASGEDCSEGYLLELIGPAEMELAGPVEWSAKASIFSDEDIHGTLAVAEVELGP